MAHRFRCEHCGKRLQSDRARGAAVLCPYCRNEVVVPAEAQSWPPAEAAEPHAEVDHREPGLLSHAAIYLPTWGTSVVMHLSLILVALMATWMVIPKTDAVEYNAEVVRRPAAKINRKVTPKMSHSIHKPRQDAPADFVFRPNVRPDPGRTKFDTDRPIDAIGLPGGHGGLPDGGFPGPPGGTRGVSVFETERDTLPTRIVYVIDRSGSMTDSMQDVKFELRRAIGALRPSQKFYVVFYSTGPGIGMPSGQLVPAVNNNKTLAAEFIDGIVPVGQTDPSDALMMAFRMKPELVWLLTDGEFDKGIVDLVDRLNASGQVRVNTICFKYRVGEALCQEIAQRNGGEYKFVDSDDLYANR